jgi:hypothetical protein
MQHTAGHVSWKGQNNHALTHFASAGDKYNQRVWLFRSLLSLMLWLHWIKYLLLPPMFVIMTNAAHQAWREQSNHTFTFCYFGWTTFIIKDVRSGCFALSGRMLAPWNLDKHKAPGLCADILHILYVSPAIEWQSQFVALAFHVQAELARIPSTNDAHL